MTATVLAALAGVVAARAVLDLGAWLVEARTARGARPSGAGTEVTGGGPAWVGRLVRLGRRAGSPAPPADLGARLEAAGLGAGQAAEVMALKAGAAVAGLLAALPVAPLLPGRLPLLAPVAAPALGFVLPDLWLRRRARARERVIAAELPDVLDLLRVALDAGLPLGRALAEVGAHDDGLLARELARAAAGAAVGVPREEALRALVRRCPGPGPAALGRTLARSARHGTPAGPVLAAQALDARADAARRLREAADRAGPKIQLAIALLLVPSVLLLVAAVLLVGR